MHYRLWTAVDVGKRLQLCEKTVRRKNLRGDLPSPVSLGGHPRWRPEIIEAWIQADCPPREEFERSAGKIE